MFTFYISYTCVECGKDVMSYFASSSRRNFFSFFSRVKANARHALR